MQQPELIQLLGNNNTASGSYSVAMEVIIRHPKIIRLQWVES